MCISRQFTALTGEGSVLYRAGIGHPAGLCAVNRWHADPGSKCMTQREFEIFVMLAKWHPPKRICQQLWH